MELYPLIAGCSHPRERHGQFTSTGRAAGISRLPRVSTVLILMLAVGGCKRTLETGAQSTNAPTNNQLPGRFTSCRDFLVVQVRYPDAAPTEVDTDVVRKLEEVFLKIPGVRAVHGIARESQAMLVLEPRDLANAERSRIEQLIDQVLDTLDLPNPDSVRKQVIRVIQREKLPTPDVARILAGLETLDLHDLKSQVRRAMNRISSLPNDSEPLIAVQPGRDRFVVVAAFGQIEPFALREWAHTLRDRLQMQPTVQRVELIGDMRREMTIRVDPAMLQKHRLRAADLANTLANMLAPSSMTQPQRADMRDVGQLGRIELAKGTDRPLYLSDVAHIELTTAKRTTVRVGRDRAILLVVRAAPDLPDRELFANVSRLSRQVAPPQVELFTSRPISVSHCHFRSPKVSGPIAILEVSGDTTDIARAIPAPTASQPPILVLQGASLLAARAHEVDTAQIISFPPHPRKASQLVRSWQETLAMRPGVSTAVVEPSTGLVTVAIEHRDRAVLDRAATQLESAVRKHREVLSVRRTAGSVDRRMNMQIRDQALASGVTATDVARFMKLALYGQVIARFWDGRDKIPVKVRIGDAGDGEIHELFAQIRYLQLMTPNGRFVPLTQFIDVRIQWSASELYRYNGRNRLVVHIQSTSDKARRAVDAALQSRLLPDLRATVPGLTATVHN